MKSINHQIVRQIAFVGVLGLFLSPIAKASESTKGEGRYQLLSATVETWISSKNEEGQSTSGAVETKRLFKIDTETGKTWYYDELVLDKKASFEWRKVRDTKEAL